MKRRGFIGKLLMGAAATALAPIATISAVNPQKIQISSTSDLDYRSLGVERMRITSSGNVIIATSTPPNTKLSTTT